MFRGVLTSSNGDPSLASLACFLADKPQQAVGTSVTTSDAATPSTGQAFYYLVGHSANASGGKDAIGRKSDGTILVSPVSCP